MVASVDQIQQALNRAKSKLATPYLLGAKWKVLDSDPVGPIDCSGFSRWVLAWAGVIIPDGSYNQIVRCQKLSVDQQDQPLDLGFFQPPESKSVDHVVIVLDDINVIEARGEPYSAVITRPKAKWLAQPGFLGWFTVPGVYLDSDSGMAS